MQAGKLSAAVDDRGDIFIAPMGENNFKI